MPRFWHQPKPLDGKKEENSMFRKYLIAGALIAGFATPTLAATAYYVAVDAKTHKCSVVTKKPDGKVMIVVGTASYPTKVLADAALKAAAECKTK